MTKKDKKVKSYQLCLTYNYNGAYRDSISWDGSDFKNNGNIWSCSTKKEAYKEALKAKRSLKAGDYMGKWIIEILESIDLYSFNDLSNTYEFKYNIEMNTLKKTYKGKNF